MRTSIVLTLLAALAVGTSLAQAAGEEQFTSPDEAINALVAAAKADDTNAFHTIFGPATRELISADPIQASNGLAMFVSRVARKIMPVHESDSKIELEIGADKWPFPIPLVNESGHWHFDTAAGKEEILNRRIGRNELATIRVCRAYVEAQREYASKPRDADGVIEYAQLLRSTPGKHDGLYWHVEPGAELSPLGPLVAQAHGEGYVHNSRIMNGTNAPYRGYLFKILTRQAGDAPGGKYSYVINGHMVAGFALAAWPAEWGNSGVMTFIVNQNGKVFEKNLGEQTGDVVRQMDSYDPDSTWMPVEEH